MPRNTLDLRKHTNLDHEIDAHERTPVFSYFVAALFAIVLALIISDWIWGSETVTYWIAELVSQ